MRRGRVYKIGGKKVFAFGGVASADLKTNMANRKLGMGWWPEEVPSQEEIERGVDALIAVDRKVDLVCITHGTAICAPAAGVGGADQEG